jgi:hypothetical protein
MPMILAPCVGGVKTILDADMPVDEFLTLQTLFVYIYAIWCYFSCCRYARAVQTECIYGEEFYSQILLLPMYVGCAQLTHILWHVDNANLLRAIVLEHENQVFIS